MTPGAALAWLESALEKYAVGICTAARNSGLACEAYADDGMIGTGVGVDIWLSPRGRAGGTQSVYMSAGFSVAKAGRAGAVNVAGGIHALHGDVTVMERGANGTVRSMEELTDLWDRFEACLRPEDAVSYTQRSMRARAPRSIQMKKRRLLR